MGHYTSENTRILATQEQAGGNTRMLLLHECRDGVHEYIVGSYFRVNRTDAAPGAEKYDLEWDWGHYFPDVVDAVDYWKREVLGVESEGANVQAR